MSLTLAEIIALQRRHHGPRRLLANLGDGYLYAKNPVFRRVRDAALGAGFRYTPSDPGGYFGFPLTSLHTVLEARRIPYRDNFASLVRLDSTRPGFLGLGDLRLNRPTPNYLLHESAHAVAFTTLFGRRAKVRAVFSEPRRLAAVMAQEAFAMTAEYFAACCVSGQPHGWFFSINSYRHHLPSKRAVGELVNDLGYGPVAWAVMASFWYNNFLVESLRSKDVDRIWAFSPVSRGIRLGDGSRRKLQKALNRLMRMDPEFRYDTTRIFLTMFGYARDIRRVLDFDPLEAAARDPSFEKLPELVNVLG